MPGAISAMRVAELDSQNAHVYSDYVSYSQIVRNDVDFLGELIKAAVSKTDDGSMIIAAIQSQICALQGDLIELAKKEYELLKVLQPDLPEKHDSQSLRMAMDAIEKAEKSKSGNPL